MLSGCLQKARPARPKPGLVAIGPGAMLRQSYPPVCTKLAERAAETAWPIPRRKNCLPRATCPARRAPRDVPRVTCPVRRSEFAHVAALTGDSLSSLPGLSLKMTESAPHLNGVVKRDYSSTVQRLPSHTTFAQNGRWRSPRRRTSSSIVFREGLTAPLNDPRSAIWISLEKSTSSG